MEGERQLTIGSVHILLLQRFTLSVAISHHGAEQGGVLSCFRWYVSPAVKSDDVFRHSGTEYLSIVSELPTSPLTARTKMILRMN